MKLIFIIFKKEMTDLLRDRRTIMAMMVLPLVLVPIVFTFISRMSLLPNDSNDMKQIRVAIQTNGNGADLLERFQLRKDLKIIEGLSPQEMNQLVIDDSLDFGLIISKNFDKQILDGKTGDLELLHKYSRRDTLLYSSFVKTIRTFRRSVIKDRLAQIGADISILNPTKIKDINLKKDSNIMGAIAGGILPIFFVLFCFMGALYPAIDLFTGEKERGTIETLLVLPVNRFQLLIGKMLVVVSTGVISGILTFLGIFLFLKFNADLPFISVMLNIKSVLWMILMMIPLTTFFAGILIPISIYAKSFKEAQSLLQPMVIVIIFPIIFGLFPGIELNIKTAFIPILNVALASKSITTGSIDYGLLALVFLSLFLLAAIGIVLAKRWFRNEASIFRT